MGKVTLTMAFLLMVLGVMVVSSDFDILPVFAKQTDVINMTKTVSSSIDKVWSIVSDLTRNPDFWPITIIKTENNTNGLVERDVNVPAPPFMDKKAHQVITVIPEKFMIIENQTQGPITGIKTIKLFTDSKNSSQTSINVLWNADLSKIPFLGKEFAKDGLNKATEEALDKINNAL